ncbi:MAG: tyrosine-type recombinase/integrase, partial [Gammaproteobacteria bacterium]|nr:tyrosine-type recombinase/integrase [Gammaproteobacteria bacterium]
MQAKRGKLTHRFVETVSEPGRYGDGRGSCGLSLLVKPTTQGWLSKSWSQRIRFGGRTTNVGLGSYPVVTLARARQKALANARMIEAGQDPRDKAGGVPSFAAAVERVIAMHAEAWRDGGKSEKQWRSSLQTYALPRIGGLSVAAVTSADVLSVLLPIWTVKHETARRVRQRISAVMKWAIAQGYRKDNPAGDAIGAALPKNGGKQRTHQKALPYGDVSAALATVRETGAYIHTRLAFEFLVLTAARSGEVRGARWDEVDFDAATWTVPGERMKGGRAHRVPLSDRALEVLREARSYSDGSDLVFPSAIGRPMSDSTLSKLLRENGIAAVPHGFRSSFRQWAAERTNIPREVAEEALAHVNPNRVEAAYQRSDLFDRRRDLMKTCSQSLPRYVIENQD